MVRVYEGEWCKSSSKFILPFSGLQWGVEIYGPYYSNYLQVMSSKTQLGMSLWLVKLSHLPFQIKPDGSQEPKVVESQLLICKIHPGDYSSKGKPNVWLPLFH